MRVRVCTHNVGLFVANAIIQCFRRHPFDRYFTVSRVPIVLCSVYVSSQPKIPYQYNTFFIHPIIIKLIFYKFVLYILTCSCELPDHDEQTCSRSNTSFLRLYLYTSVSSPPTSVPINGNTLLSVCSYKLGGLSVGQC